MSESRRFSAFLVDGGVAMINQYPPKVFFAAFPGRIKNCPGNSDGIRDRVVFLEIGYFKLANLMNFGNSKTPIQYW
jgi:hypothetical protein